MSRHLIEKGRLPTKGSNHWRWQKISSVSLLPLAIWFVLSVMTLVPLDYTAAADWMKQPVHAFLMALFVCLVSWHLLMGLEIVIDDYLHDRDSNQRATTAVKWFFSSLAVVGVISIFKILLQ